MCQSNDVHTIDIQEYYLVVKHQPGDAGRVDFHSWQLKWKN